jgi:hypothetical protein
LIVRRAFVILALLALALACGETRRPIGDECLRDDDCLSGACANRTCVSAPTLVTGAAGSPPDETPQIPAADAATAPKDASAEGG